MSKSPENEAVVMTNYSYAIGEAKGALTEATGGTVNLSVSSLEAIIRGARLLEERVENTVDGVPTNEIEASMQKIKKLASEIVQASEVYIDTDDPEKTTGLK